SRNPQTDQRSTISRMKKVEGSPHQFGAFAHGYYPNSFSRFRRLRHDSFSVVFYFQLQTLFQKAKPYPCLTSTSVACDVVQCLLQHTIDVNRRRAVNLKWLARFFIRYDNACLPFHSRNVPFESRLESCFVENDGMQ